MSKVMEVSAQDFDKEVLRANTPVLVDFWAEWCGPCRIIAPSVDDIAEEYAGKLKVCKINIENEGAVAARYGIMSIPTLMLFKDGKVAEQIVGVQPKQNIVAKILPHLS